MQPLASFKSDHQPSRPFDALLYSTDVAAIIEMLLHTTQATLGEKLIGLYLRGSVATGDFDPVTSDIDFFTVVDQRVSATDFVDLAAMHTTLAQLPNRYAQQLEGCYIERSAVQHFLPGQRYPTIARGELLAWSQHDYNWLLERWVVRERGITLIGPPPQTLIAPISADALRNAVRLRLPVWAAWANQPDDPDWSLPRSHKAYVIETMCRALYTMAHGTLVSKPVAMAWACVTLPEPWRSTAERAQAWHADTTDDPTILPVVRDFVLWTAAQMEEA